VATIAIIGAGQIGSRHLQGLARSTRAFDVVVVDPSAPALETARQRYGEIAGAAGRGVHYATSLAALPERVDLAIVATAASMRRQVMRDLLARCRVRHAVLEKVLVQRPADLPAVAGMLEKAGTSAWVNCPRRLSAFYAGLRDRLARGDGLRMGVQGGAWDLGCNAIHFIDLYAFLTGARVAAIDTSGVDARWYPSKRAGVQEIAGTLRVHYENGGRLELHSRAEGAAPILVTLEAKDAHVVIWEKAGRAHLALAREPWRLDQTEFRLAFQSELTHLVAERLLEHGDCGLTTYAESAALHESLLAALLAWSRDALGQSLDAVPIT
jgi:predicted dehydrogenase